MLSFTVGRLVGGRHVEKCVAFFNVNAVMPGIIHRITEGP